HNSVLQIPGKDEWYIVYHRINPNFRERQLSPGTHRQVCIDRMTFDKKGRIEKVKPTR
ncbi:MAG: family 43 glycosylhydrolase, partial [Prevotella sp.]|nr:family 43 glycosylhydrolase [Prevotella sp.]